MGPLLGIRPLVLLLGLLTFLAAACKPDPPGDGFLNVQVHVLETPTGELSGLKSLSFNASRVDVVHRLVADDPSTERVLTVLDEERAFTVTLTKGRKHQVAVLPVPPGFVTQIRFVVSPVMATFTDGRTAAVTLDQDVRGRRRSAPGRNAAASGDAPLEMVVSVKVPSGAQSGLKLVAPKDAPFPIRADETTVVAAQFDPNTGIVRNRGVGLILKPTIPTVLLPPLTDEPAPPQFVPGHLYVMFKRGTSRERIDQIHAEMGAAVVRTSRRHPWDVIRLAPGSDERTSRDQYRDLPRWRLRCSTTTSTPRTPSRRTGQRVTRRPRSSSGFSRPTRPRRGT